MNKQADANKESQKVEERLSKALSDLFDPFMKYFESQECILTFKYMY